MATLRTESAVFSQESLKAGIVDAVWERGSAEILSLLSFNGENGENHRHNVLADGGSGMGVRDPFDNTSTVEVAQATAKTFRTYPGQILRDFTVPVHAQVVMGDTNDQLAMEAFKATVPFYTSFMQQFFHGDGTFSLNTSDSGSRVGVNLCGLDYWLKVYCGWWKSGTYTSSSSDDVLINASTFKDQKYFATTTGEPEYLQANRVVLGYQHLDRLATLIKGFGNNIALIMSRKSWHRVTDSLAASGGNTQTMLMGEDGGIRVPVFRQFPVIVSDVVGAPYSFTATSSGVGATIQAGSLDTLEIKGNTAFYGFDERYVGGIVTVTGADFSAASGHSTAVDDNGKPLASNQSRIKQILSNRNVLLEYAAGSAVADAAFSLAEIPVIYAVRFDPLDGDGLFAWYGLGQAARVDTYDADAGEYRGTIAGFDVRYLGESDTGAVNKYRMSFDGQAVISESPTNIARLSGFKLV